MGYKAYRAEVMRALVLQHNFSSALLAGPPAKAPLLHIIAEKGGQILDLEGPPPGLSFGADLHHPNPANFDHSFMPACLRCS